MVCMILFVIVFFVLETTGKQIQLAEQASSIDWNQIPHDDDEVFHSVSLQKGGSVRVLQHQRSVLSCDQKTSYDGFIPDENVVQGGNSRKLKQVTDSVLGQLVDQAILGSDDRFQVQDTLLFPFSSVGLLVFEAVSSGKRSFCTGTMVSQYAMVTSAHCIWDRSLLAYNSNFKFYPARNGNIKPYGNLDWSQVIVPSAWTQNGTQQFDYAVIRLAQPVGNLTGYLGFGYSCGYENNPSNETYGLMGYPLDKDNQLWMDRCKVEKFDPCKADTPGEPQIINHECDTLGGQSGSVLWKIVDDRAEIRGIHQGYTFTNVDYNNAIALTAEVFDFIIRNMYPQK